MRTIRNRVTAETVLGFKSPSLRQKRNSFELLRFKRVFLVFGGCFALFSDCFAHTGKQVGGILSFYRRRAVGIGVIEN